MSAPIKDTKDKPQGMSGVSSTTVRTKDVLKQVPNAAKAKRIAKLLNELDAGKSGSADVLKMLDMIVSLRRQRFWLLLLLFMLLSFACVTLLSVVGIGYAVTAAIKEAIKDTQVNLIDPDTVVGAGGSAYPAVDGGVGPGGMFAAAGPGGGAGAGVGAGPGGSGGAGAAGSRGGRGGSSAYYPSPTSVPRSNSPKNTPAYFFSRFMSLHTLMDIKYLFLSACVPDGPDEEPACLRLKLTVRPLAP